MCFTTSTTGFYKPSVIYHIKMCFITSRCVLITTSEYVQVSPRSGCVLPHQGMFKSLLDQDVFHHNRVLGSASGSVSSLKVLFSSVQDGIYALRKAHMHSTSSLRSFPSVAFETVSMYV